MPLSVCCDGSPWRHLGVLPDVHREPSPAFCPFAKNLYGTLLTRMSSPERLGPVLLALLLGSACGTATPPSLLTPEGSMPTRRILANGVRVVVQEFHAGDVVAVQLWLAVGARDEASRALGLAHSLEQMVVKGTPSRAPGFVDREVEGGGGRLNAGTSLDYTYYHHVLPAPRATAAIELLADLSVNSTLGDQTLDLQ